MNLVRLKTAQERFLLQYPGGFSHPAMLEIARKHKVEKMKQLAQEHFGAGCFEAAGPLVEALGKVVSQSSLISVFEKPRFRDLIRFLSSSEKELLALGLKEFLHGDQPLGFRMMADLLAEYKLAKWPLLTVPGIYYRPEDEVFIKPTTAKGIIEHFELAGLKYSPRPTFEFYAAYRENILQLKERVDPSLQVDNAAFCGFLMMSLEIR